MMTAVVFFLSGEADLGRVAVLDADVFPVADPIELFFVDVGDRPTGEDAVVRFVVGLFRIVAGVVGIRVVDELRPDAGFRGLAPDATPRRRSLEMGMDLYEVEGLFCGSPSSTPRRPGLIEGHVGARGERRVDPREITRRAMPRRAVRRVRCPGACRSGADTARLPDISHTCTRLDRRETTFFPKDFFPGIPGLNAPSQTRRFRFERRFQNLDLKLARQLDNQITTLKMARSRRQGKKPPGPNAADVTPKSPPQHKPRTPRPPTNLSPPRTQPNTNTTPPTTGGRLRVKSRTDGNTTDVPTLKEPFTPGGSTRYEAVGGRVQASDGTWVAYALTRPVPRPGNPKSSLLVTVNGLSNDGFQWSGLVPTLKKEHAVLAWDYRGHGCSEDPRDVNAVSIESLAEDMQLVLDDVDNR